MEIEYLANQNQKSKDYNTERDDLKYNSEELKNNFKANDLMVLWELNQCRFLFKIVSNLDRTNAEIFENENGFKEGIMYLVCKCLMVKIINLS